MMAGISILAMQLFLPYLNVIILALVIVQIFHPLYKFFIKTLRSKGISTFLSIIFVLILFVLPLTAIIILAVNEVQNIISSTEILNSGIFQSFKDSIVGAINNINNVVGAFQSLKFEEIVKSINGDSGQVITQILTVLKDTISLGGVILFNIFLLILCLIFFFPAYENLGNIFSKISPLDDKLDLLLVKKFKETTKGVLRGSFFVAILQATAVLIPLLLLQVGAPVLLWIIMVILSIIPIGSGIVWAPVGIAMIINGISTGNTGQSILGIGLIIYSAIIINVIDSVFRPILLKNSVNLHPLVTIFSVLGGISAFGIFGILYGPLIVVFFISITQIYRYQYLLAKDDLEKYEEDSSPTLFGRN